MTEPVAVPRQSGSKWKLAGRIVVSVVVLALLIWKGSSVEDAIPDRHPALTVALLGAAVFTALIGVWLSAWRWQRVLLLFDAKVRLPALFSHYVVGLLVGNVLPSTIGGDVVRVARAGDTVGSSKVSFASVVLERLTGFVALPLLVFIGFAIDPALFDAPHAWIAVGIAVGTLVLLGVILLVVGHPRLAGRFAERENWSRFIGAVHIGVERLRREPGQVFPILGTAMLFQISQIAMFGLIFRALDLDIPIAAVIAFTPAVLMLQVLPISFSGLGVREGALVLFFKSFGVSNGQAIAAGVLWWGCMVAVSALGAPAFAVGNRATATKEPV